MLPFRRVVPAILAVGCARAAVTTTTPTEAPARSPATTAAGLEDVVRARLRALRAEGAVYARDLATGRELAVRADVPVNTLSIIKVPIMVLAYRDAQAGRLDLDARHTIRSDELRRGSGLLQTFAVGLQPTYRDLVAQMIITSDNTATDIMIGKLGLARVNEMLASLGYRETRLRATTGQLFRGLWELVDPAHRALTDRKVFERGSPGDTAAAARGFAYATDSTKWLGRSTARETARLFEQLQRGELAGKASTEEMLRVLRRQFYSSRLPQRLRFRTAIAHKTGDWPPVSGSDAGIIYAERGPIAVAVYTNANRGSFFDLEATIGLIAQDLVEAWGARAPAGPGGGR